MLGNDLKVVDGAAAGAWIKPRLEGEIGMVCQQVPKGFEAYARILHPADDSGGNPVRWAEVAAACGTTAHAEMQWNAIIGAPDPRAGPGAKWEGGEPSIGGMDLDELDALCELLAVRTSDPEDCFFGLCRIWAWCDDLFPLEKQEQPELKLPLGRDHLVLQGPLAAVDQIGQTFSQSKSSWVAVKMGEGSDEPPEMPKFSFRYAPSLIWPSDHSWLVASEVDFDSTLVGGSAELIEAIIESPALEAWIVEPTTSLTCDADKINV